MLLTAKGPHSMGKGPSPLQNDILALLAVWPAYVHDATATQLHIGDWARPRDIITGLGRPESAVTSASVSRALARLSERGLVMRAAGQPASVGRAFRYARIRAPIP